MATLNFKGKSFVQNHHLLVKYHQLIPQKDKSLTKKVSLSDNLIIHGDNLKALKALLPIYGGKIKCIYIDPPYNTGNEKWVYNDNVNSPMMQDWLGRVVDKEELTRHDMWLCMMMPRLKLLRELLSEDGVIFISIDDNEVHRLRSLMDDIFGEDNFVHTLKWKRKKQPSYLHGHVAATTEYILIYANRIEYLEKLSIDARDGGNTRVDNSGNEISERTFKKGIKVKLSSDIKIISKGIYKNKTMQTEYLSDVYIENGRTKNDVVVRTRFRNNQNQINLFADKDVLFITKNYGLRRDLLPEELEKRKSITDLLLDWGDNQESDREINAIFPEGKPFEYPKPSLLVKNIVKSLIYNEDEDFTVLDSFAGTGVTAHAVLGLNKEDDGNRKFVLVEMEGYADKITAERVRRVIKGVKNAKDKRLKEGLGGTFSYFELGKPIEMESILDGDGLPSYKELARYVFYTATGEEFDETAVDEENNFIGESKEYLVYLIYKPDMEFLKSTALTLERAKKLGAYKKKKRLVFAPTKYLDQDHLDELRIDFAQLPFEIYKLAK